MKIKSIIGLFVSIIVFFCSFAFGAHPEPWQLNLQPPATPLMEELVDFHNKLLYVCFGISGFVLIMIIYIAIRFNKKANPVPSKTSHNTALEIIWTLIPVAIICVIGFSSLKILYHAEHAGKVDMTIKVIGHQWYWEYNYPDHGNINFDSYMVQDSDIKPGMFRLLEVDNRVVVPVNKVVKIVVTGADVIHSWAIPAFGIKTDAIPGRANEAWFKVTKPGVYYGQCSEICGVNHGFMPIAVEAVTQEQFEDWVKAKQQAK